MAMQDNASNQLGMYYMEYENNNGAGMNHQNRSNGLDMNGNKLSGQHYGGEPVGPDGMPLN